jgi:hypothetical protein
MRNYFLLLGLLIPFLFVGCEKESDSDLNGDKYFPLNVGNRWEYQIITKTSGKADVIDNYVIEIISANKNDYTANITVNAGTASQVIFSKTDSKITVGGKTFLTNSSSSCALGQFYRLFYGPNITMFSGNVSYGAGGDELVVYFTDSWTNYYADMDLQFEDTYKKGIGLIKSKWDVLTSSAYAISGTDAYGSLKKAIINGKEYNF